MQQSTRSASERADVAVLAAARLSIEPPAVVECQLATIGALALQLPDLTKTARPSVLSKGIEVSRTMGRELRELATLIGGGEHGTPTQLHDLAEPARIACRLVRHDLLTVQVAAVVNYGAYTVTKATEDFRAARTQLAHFRALTLTMTFLAAGGSGPWNRETPLPHVLEALQDPLHVLYDAPKRRPAAPRVTIENRCARTALITAADHTVLYQLVRNALEQKSVEHVVISAQPRDAGILLSVQDDGAGISRRVLPKIFTAYSSKGEGQGGLGLQFVHSVLRTIGKNIRVDTQNHSFNPDASMLVSHAAGSPGTRFSFW